MKRIAALIPDWARRKILEENIIIKAKPNGSDYHMHYLITIWKEYVEPNVALTCASCYERVKNNWVALQSILIEIEQEERLLNDVN